MIDVTAQQLYDQACQALGEAVVRERFLATEAQRLSAEVERLTKVLLGEATGLEPTP